MKWLWPTNFSGLVNRRSIAAAIVLGTVFTAIPAMAQVEKTATSVIWSAFAGSRDGTPTCGVGAQLPDRSFTVSVQRDRPGLVRITVGTPGWDGEQVPRHTDISFEPSGELYGLTSGGSAGHFDYFDLDSAKVRAWVHDFTAGSKMTLSFPDEAAWSFDLTGTSPTISAMLQCVTDNNIADLPAPFALAAQPEMPSRPTPAQIAPPATETRATAINQNAGAAIIKLMCDYQYVICRPNRSPPCSEPKSDQIFLPLDLTKHTVRNNPAEITDDYIRWGGLRHSYGIDNVTASINRKTGAFSSETETTYPDGNQLTNTWTGECQIAPANKF